MVKAGLLRKNNFVETFLFFIDNNTYSTFTILLNYVVGRFVAIFSKIMALFVQKSGGYGFSGRTLELFLRFP